MKKESAILAISLINDANEALNNLTVLSIELEDKDEQVVFRKHLAPAMIGISDALMHVVKQYPDLDPDKNSGDTIPNSKAD